MSQVSDIQLDEAAVTMADFAFMDTIAMGGSTAQAVTASLKAYQWAVKFMADTNNALTPSYDALKEAMRDG